MMLDDQYGIVSRKQRLRDYLHGRMRALVKGTDLDQIGASCDFLRGNPKGTFDKLDTRR